VQVRHCKAWNAEATVLPLSLISSTATSSNRRMFLVFQSIPSQSSQISNSTRRLGQALQHALSPSVEQNIKTMTGETPAAEAGQL
jgi:hypothetical protein